MSRRRNFRITTKGIDIDSPPKYQDDQHAVMSKKVLGQNPSVQFAYIASQYDKVRLELLSVYKQNSYQFICAVARGIGKKPNDLLLDTYAPFDRFLEKYAASLSKAKKIPKAKIRLGAGNPGEEFSESSEEIETGTEEQLETTEEKSRFTAGNISYDAFSALFSKWVANNHSTQLHKAVADADIMFAFLRFKYHSINRPNDNPIDVLNNIGFVTVELPTWIGNGQEKTFYDIITNRTQGNYVLQPSQSQPTSLQDESELINQIETLLSFKKGKAVVDISYELFKYEMLPEKFHSMYFGPDLIFGIGQAMQKLREEYRFQKKNDRLFAEFVENEKWRDLFVSLVSCILNLQQKLTAFNAPQGTIRMLRTDINAYVSKFRDYPGFSNSTPISKYNI
jgi:hypothetical protein